VEINATFYRLPTVKVVRGWHDRSPEEFVFAVKGSRYLTHIRRLKDTGPGLRKYFSRLKPLAEHTGPILWQLPPSFQKTEENQERLERFLLKLPRTYRHAVEFRHPSWMAEKTFALLRTHHVANVWLSSLRMPADHAITADFIYLRFHGLEGGAYHDYTDDELRPWAEQLVKAARKGIPSFVYFNNDLNTRAPLNAHALMRLVGDRVVESLVPDAATPRDLPPPVKGPETWRPWTRVKRANLRAKNRPRALPKSHRRVGRRTNSPIAMPRFVAPRVASAASSPTRG
jgi:uncharacterized protein YecE (DUF72 family)